MDGWQALVVRLRSRFAVVWEDGAVVVGEEESSRAASSGDRVGKGIVVVAVAGMSLYRSVGFGNGAASLLLLSGMAWMAGIDARSGTSMLMRRILINN